MRRALYHGQTLELNEPFLYKMSGHVVQMMKDAYPELLETERHIAKAIKIEEERYAHTTRLGLEKLSEIIDGYGSFADGAGSGLGDGAYGVGRLDGSGFGGFVLSGQDLFKLHDTYGLRPDFVEDILRIKGGSVDRQGYEAEMAQQRERARASWKGVEKKTASPVFLKLAEERKTIFDGYTQTTSADCRVVALVIGGRGG